jgi:multiple sugar transport system permease protein
LIAAGALAFIFSWNEFSVALTSPAGLPQPCQSPSPASTKNTIQYGQMAAASILPTIATLILMFFGQRFVVQGLTMAAVK